MLLTGRDTALEEGEEGRRGTGALRMSQAVSLSEVNRSVVPTNISEPRFGLCPVCGLPRRAAGLAAAVVLPSRAIQPLKYRCRSSHNLVLRSFTTSSTVHNRYRY